MAGEDRSKMTHEEFDRLSRQFTSTKEDEMGLWNLGPSKFEQGNFLAIRRVVRFACYQVVKNQPGLFHEKVFTTAYLPFSMRHNMFLMGAISLSYIFYSSCYRAWHSNR